MDKKENKKFLLYLEVLWKQNKLLISIEKLIEDEDLNSAKEIIRILLKKKNYGELKNSLKLLLGKIFLLEGNFKKAKMEFGEILENEINNNEAKFYMAKTLLGMGNHQYFISLLNYLIMIDANNPQYYYDLGKYYNSTGLVNEALNLLTKSLNLGKNDDEINLELGFSYQLLNDKENCIKYYEKVVNYKSTNTYKKNNANSSDNNEIPGSEGLKKLIKNHQNDKYGVYCKDIYNIEIPNYGYRMLKDGTKEQLNYLIIVTVPFTDNIIDCYHTNEIIGCKNIENDEITK